MTAQPDILCIGAVLWDIIGRTDRKMGVGHDVAGRITRIPGGVALNIAMALTRADLSVELLCSVGRDAEGDSLLAEVAGMGLGIAHVLRAADLPTDQYMAIEGANGLIAAIADAHSLEEAGDRILEPLKNGLFGAPFAGCIALDGNLTEELLAQIANDPLFARADLRVAPASPGKVGRLKPLLGHPGLTLYLNRLEVGLMLEQDFATSTDAAHALRALGVRRVVVTDSADAAAVATDDGLITGMPPTVEIRRITGAGDTFMANHIAAELGGQSQDMALQTALIATARYVSTESLT